MYVCDLVDMPNVIEKELVLTAILGLHVPDLDRLG